MKFSKEKENSIIQDYLNGKNTVQIAKKWNTYNTSIRRVLLRNNILIRSNVIAHTNVPVCPFKDGDEYSEYFLGLLLTDGCISRRTANSATITLSLIDEEIVKMSGKENPKVLFIGLASSVADSYYDYVKNIYKNFGKNKKNVVKYL